jgi:hypothetical protein
MGETLCVLYPVDWSDDILVQPKDGVASLPLLYRQSCTILGGIEGVGLEWS